MTQQSWNTEREHVSPASVQSALKGADYPASKDDLVQLAERNGAPKPIMDKIRELPGQRFQSPADVMRAFGRID
jgi:hypothetical protein